MCSSRRTLVVALGILVAHACTPFEAAVDRPLSTETTPKSDAGADGRDGSTEGGAPAAGGFCERARLEAPYDFCDEFEDLDRDAASGWDRIVAGPGDRIAIGRGPGGAHALHVELAPAAETRGAHVTRSVGFRPGASRLELELRVFVVETSLDYARLGSFWLAGPSYFHASGLSIFIRNEGVLDGDEDGEEPRFRGPLGVWRSALVTLDRQADGSYVSRTTVDGTRVSERADVDVSPMSAAALLLGAFSTSTNQGSIELWFDDVLVRAR